MIWHSINVILNVRVDDIRCFVLLWSVLCQTPLFTYTTASLCHRRSTFGF